MKKDATIINELSAILSNKRKTASVLGHVELVTLETITSKLSVYLQARKDEEQAQREALENTQTAIEAVLLKTGLSWDEVSRLANTQVSKRPVRNKNKRNPMTSKTVNTENQGVCYKDGEHEWDGTGSQPEWIKERLEMGFELTEFETLPSA